MAVNRIILRDGKKVCIPILKKEEYIALRDSKYNLDCVEKARKGEMLKDKNGNEKSYKTRLEQFNYSCYPNEDGTLKGTTKPADSVGMDIDLCVPKELPEGVTKEKWIQDEILNISKNILDKKEEIGLLLCERSATKGLHIVFRRDVSLDQEGNLKRVSDVLGVPFDEAAKDITRVFFTPTSADILYIAEGLFKRTPIPNPFPVKGQGSKLPLNAHSKGSLQTPCPSTGKGCPKDGKGVAEKSNLIAFDLCVKEAGLNPDALDVFGEHNWHKNLMSVLSAGLAKLMSREQAFAVVAEKLPNYSQYDDCKALINYFYDNYNTSFMPPAVREINARAQYLARHEVSEEDREMAELMEGWDAPKLPEKLPPLVELLVSNYDKRFKEMLCLSALPVMAALASHFRAQYLNGRVIGPQTYVAVIGGSGSGKGNCSALFKDMIEGKSCTA